MERYRPIARLERMNRADLLAASQQRREIAEAAATVRSAEAFLASQLPPRLQGEISLVQKSTTSQTDQKTAEPFIQPQRPENRVSGRW